MNEGMNDQTNNSQYVRSCGEARAHLAELIRARGRECSVEHMTVITRIKDPKTGCMADARVTIMPRSARYSREYISIKVQVERTRHPVTYKRSHSQWQEFPWEQIVNYHLTELDSRLAGNVATRRCQEEQDRLNDLAQQEVPLPVDPGPHAWAALTGFDRQRGADGTYSLRVTASGFTAAEACAVRDIVIAALNRQRPAHNPITLPSHDSKTEAPSPQEAAA